MCHWNLNQVTLDRTFSVSLVPLALPLGHASNLYGCKFEQGHADTKIAMKKIEDEDASIASTVSDQ